MTSGGEAVKLLQAGHATRLTGTYVAESSSLVRQYDLHLGCGVSV